MAEMEQAARDTRRSEKASSESDVMSKPEQVCPGSADPVQRGW